MSQKETNTQKFSFALYFIAMGMALLVVQFYNHISFPLCPFKLLTGLPCPGCGGLRAANALIHGEVSLALYTNPLSCLLVLFFAMFPLLYLCDKLCGTTLINKILFRPYSKTTTLFIFVLILCNWAWNIYKCL